MNPQKNNPTQMNRIITKVTYTDHEGKKKSESYLVLTDSFTEAESKTIKEYEYFKFDNLTISSVTRLNIAEIIQDEANIGKWYRIKSEVIVLNERTHAEKRISQNWLVQAEDITKALLRHKTYMSMKDYEVTKVSLTPIIDILS